MTWERSIAYSIVWHSSAMNEALRCFSFSVNFISSLSMKTKLDCEMSKSRRTTQTILVGWNGMSEQVFVYFTYNLIVLRALSNLISHKKKLWVARPLNKFSVCVCAEKREQTTFKFELSVIDLKFSFLEPFSLPLTTFSLTLAFSWIMQRFSRKS